MTGKTFIPGSGDDRRVPLPAELHGMATHPALPAIPAVVFVGPGLRGERKYNLIPPTGGHTLLDYYFASVLAALPVLYGFPPLQDEATDEQLDRMTRLAWRAALSSVRTRPLTNPVPEGVPEKGI